MIQETLRDITERALKNMGVPADMAAIQFDHPTDTKFGDFSTNVAMLLFKQLGATAKSPFELAEKITAAIQEEVRLTRSTIIAKVEAVRPGFINFYLTKTFFQQSLAEAIEKTAWYGKGIKLWNKKIIIEHTNLNPFKPFHIGHLVNNAIGESLSRILEWQDAKLTRASYGGDIGLHVAKTLFAIMKMKDEIPENADPKTYIEILGAAYIMGNAVYEEDVAAQEQIKIINKKIFDKSDAALNKLYEWGRDISLAYFKELYARLDTRVDLHFFESQVAAEGIEVVMQNVVQGIFEKSEGAIIYPGEKKGLHNRVFITSQGLPTYEAKEIGLTRKKFEYENFDKSIIVTANEQDDYFKVVLMAIADIYPEIASRTQHLSHGMLRFASGKMSSRKGNIITGESLIEDIEAMVAEKIKDRDYTDAEKTEIKTLVGRAAIKYSILKQSIGKDIIFDPERSLSFEGDSGPYLQYSYVRAKSILEKADKEKVSADPQGVSTDAELPLERLLYRFPNVVERAGKEFAPQYIATYLTELAATFNSYYASNKIVDKADPSSAYKIALTTGVQWTLKNGLYLLGIEVPKKM